MTIEESLWIRARLAKMDLPVDSDILDIGSSDSHYRQSLEPHIDENVFLPLRARGLNIVHMDIKSGQGIDIAADIEDPAAAARITGAFGLVICANMLEHVNDVRVTAKNVAGLVPAGGYLLVTAPLKWPRHNDPIDNSYRVSDEGLQELFAGYFDFEVISSEVLDIRNRKHYVGASRHPLWRYRKFRFWRRCLRSFRWKISCLLIKRH